MLDFLLECREASQTWRQLWSTMTHEMKPWIIAYETRCCSRSEPTLYDTVLGYDRVIM